MQLLPDIHIHIHNAEGEEILHELHNLKQLIMASFQEIKAEFDTLKAAIADERTQINNKLAELQAKIDELTTNINEGGTVEERTQLLADVAALVVEVNGIIPDVVTPPTT